MKIITDPKRMQATSEFLGKQNKTIGFVPTMGALHKGHLKLVKEAKKSCDIVIVSIFVNPTQFGPKEDFKKYPRNIKRDIALLKKEEVDILFYPGVKAMYPDGNKTFIEVKDLGNKLCGASRPGHFNGVTTVVAKLFNIVKPDIAFFGEKDFQQQAIIKKMVKDLNFDVIIKTIPTVREIDGLAKSSRNRYLSKDERIAAVLLSKSLKKAKRLIQKGEKNAKTVKTEIIRTLRNPQLKIDHVSICDPDTFDDKNTIKGPTLIALAVFCGKTRLIDNILIKN